MERKEEIDIEKQQPPTPVEQHPARRPADAGDKSLDGPAVENDGKSSENDHGYPPKITEVSTDSDRGAVGEIIRPKQNGIVQRLMPIELWLRRWINVIIQVVIAAVFTAWWIAGLVLHRHDMNWLVPFLLWLCIVLRIVTLYVPLPKYLMKALRLVWKNSMSRAVAVIPSKARLPLGALGTLCVIIVGAMASPETADNTRKNRGISLAGLVLLIFFMALSSRNPRAINWHTVIVGMLTQFIIALFVLRTQVGYDIFDFLSLLCRLFLGFAGNGLAFLTTEETASLGWFLISVVPAIIFFIACVQVLYYWGVLQWAIAKFAVFFFWSLRVSGAEAVVAAASPFIGQGESAMLIKPFIKYLTQAELHQVMASGFATIAGSVLVAYIGLGIDGRLLISSCVMSIPASLAISKLRYPEEEEPMTSGHIVIPENDEDEKPTNSLHAFANGAWIGLKIGGMIVATLLCIISVVALINGFLTWMGHYINLRGKYDLTLELILGYIFYPVAALLGVSTENGDILRVAKLIGIKIIENEFVAYGALVDPESEYSKLSKRSHVIATYALCGFGNLGSMGTQIGVLSQISPDRTADVSRLAISALISGIFSTLSSAAVAGLLIVDEGGVTAGVT